MSDNHAELEGAVSHQFETHHLPGGYIRVLDLDNGEVEGYWNSDEKTWFDYQAFMDHHTGGADG